MAKKQLLSDITSALTQRASQGLGAIGANEIAAQVGGSRPTVNRYLAKLVAGGAILRQGTGPATVYTIAAPVQHALSTAAKARPNATHKATARLAFSVPWSDRARALRTQLEAPIGTRTPVTYQRQFVDTYSPNQSSLLPTPLADELFAAGRAQGQQPASTYARKVLEQLLIDLSWHSSRLEGNRTPEL